jgi:uncharacterized membrane protein YcaP (DUF421 family)
MQPDEIDIFDYRRIAIGEVPLTFFIETFIRAGVIYFLLLICMRLLGKRMAGQLSRNDLISLTTLAAAAGVPLQAPDRGLLPSIIIAMIVVTVGRIISRWSMRSQKFETASQDKLNILVEEGVMQQKSMKDAKITRHRLFAFIRSQGIPHLGHVKRVYLEAGGLFTLVRQEPALPGLSVIPTGDCDFKDQFTRSSDICVCFECGKPIHENPPYVCPNCKNTTWSMALTG